MVGCKKNLYGCSGKEKPDENDEYMRDVPKGIFSNYSNGGKNEGFYGMGVGAVIVPEVYKNSMFPNLKNLTDKFTEGFTEGFNIAGLKFNNVDLVLFILLIIWWIICAVVAILFIVFPAVLSWQINTKSDSSVMKKIFKSTGAFLMNIIVPGSYYVSAVWSGDCAMKGCESLLDKLKSDLKSGK